MVGRQRQTIWFGRLVLVAATGLFATIAAHNLLDPAGAMAPHGITLGSAAGVTIARVGFGGFPLAFSVILLVCLTAERRLLAGLGLLSILAAVVTLARLLGVVLDGPAPFTLHVLKPEVALVVASTAALWLERRRRHRGLQVGI